MPRREGAQSAGPPDQTSNGRILIASFSHCQKKLFLLFLASCKSRSYLLNELKFPGPLERCLLYCKFCVSICKFV